MEAVSPESVGFEEWETDWLADFHVAETYHLRNAELLLESDTYRNIKRSIVAATDFRCTIRGKERSRDKESYHGISAKSKHKNWDKKMRNTLTEEGWHTEISVFGNIILDRKISGMDEPKHRFDIGTFDDRYNLSKIWDRLYGNLPIEGADSKWRGIKRRDFTDRQTAVNVENRRTEGVAIVPQSPTVLGELQNGNWGLVFRDLLKVASAERRCELDLFVYVVPTGRFQQMLSDQIVNYSDTVDFLEEFRSVISTPVWLIGLDIEEFYALD